MSVMDAPGGLGFEWGQAIRLRFTLGDVCVEPRSVALVLGYPNGEVPEVVVDAVEQVLAHGEALWGFEGGFRVLPEVSVDRHCLSVAEERFEIGKVIGGELSRATGLAVFVCTAGAGIEELSRSLSRAGDPFTAFVADAIGSLAVESAMDRVARELARRAAMEGLSVTNRYSPGYCGWNVSEQQKLFRLLPPGFCGVKLTESSLMQPIKSVSGIVGLGREVRQVPYTCRRCDQDACLYRRIREEGAPLTPGQ